MPSNTSLEDNSLQIGKDFITFYNKKRPSYKSYDLSEVSKKEKKPNAEQVNLKINQEENKSDRAQLFQYVRYVCKSTKNNANHQIYVIPLPQSYHQEEC